MKNFITICCLFVFAIAGCNKFSAPKYRITLYASDGTIIKQWKAVTVKRIERVNKRDETLWSWSDQDGKIIECTGTILIEDLKQETEKVDSFRNYTFR